MKIQKIFHNKNYDVDICVVDFNKLPVIMYHGKILKPYLRKSNSKWQYPMINIPNHGEQYCHRLIAYASKQKLVQYYKLKNSFPNETIIVDHINGNTLDYSYHNLQFLTNSQNVLKATKKGENYMSPVSYKQCILLKLDPMKYLNPEWFIET